MSYAHHTDDASLVVDLVDEPMVADAHAVRIDSYKPLGSPGPGLSKRAKTFRDPLEQSGR